MKYWLRISLFVAGIGLVQFSQGQAFKGGFLVGVNAAQIDGDNLSGYNKLGLHGGISISREFNKIWGVRGEIVYSMKGAAKSNLIGNTPSPDILRTTMHYVEVPILAQYTITRFTIETGPSFGVIIRASREDNFGKFVNTDAYDRLEFAYHLGLAYNFKNRWSIYSRFSYSLDCVSGANCGNLFNNPRFRAGFFNNVISLGIRRKFNS